MIAFLHTISANVDKFELLAQKYAPGVQVKHFVNEAILTNALKNGKPDCEGFNAEVDKIKALNPTKIICTCSTYGDACDRTVDIERIDEPIVSYIVSKFKKIGLAYTASSTRTTSEDLIKTCATVQGKDVEIFAINCTDAWPLYEQKNQVQYNKKIAGSIKEQASNVDVVFLAQASMEGASEFLQNIGVEVLTSPEFGVKSYLMKKGNS